jgi:hypothetical protein
VLAGTVLLCSCRTVGPDYQRPQVPWLDNWKGGSPAPLTAESRAQLGLADGISSWI